MNVPSKNKQIIDKILKSIKTPQFDFISGSDNKTNFSELEINGFFDITEIKRIFGSVRVTNEYQTMFDKLLGNKDLLKGE